MESDVRRGTLVAVKPAALFALILAIVTLISSTGAPPALAA